MKICNLAVQWSMSGVVRIKYEHPEELAELIKNINLPVGKMIPGSYKLDDFKLQDINDLTTLDDLHKALKVIQDE